jgi:hypothetical protein
MVRKTKTPVSQYVNLTGDDVSGIVMATNGAIKDKQVDPRKLIGTIHIKKYLADAKINGKVETWISIIKKLLPAEGETPAELTSEEVAALEDCKVATKDYLEDEASSSLKAKVAESTDELKNLKDISSSMKYKFSKYAYEVVTHVINLMVREILVFTCDNCASQKAKLTKASHIPWVELQSKQLAGLYMNTKAVFDSVHPVADEIVEDAAEEEVVVEDAAGEEVNDDAEADVVEEVKTTKPRLSQYISNTFKEIVARDERFKGLLLGKEVTKVLNEVIYQTLDRFSNVIKSLLDTANSKTVNERLALIATKILLQDHIHSSTSDIATILDVVQGRLDDLKAQPEDDSEEAETTDAPTEAAPVETAKPKKGKK